MKRLRWSLALALVFMFGATVIRLVPEWAEPIALIGIVLAANFMGMAEGES